MPKQHIEELNRLTINKLKGGPDFLLYGIGGEALTKVYNQAIKPAARILFYDGESPVLKEAAKQTQDIIKNDVVNDLIRTFVAGQPKIGETIIIGHIQGVHGIYGTRKQFRASISRVDPVPLVQEESNLEREL